jgi:hypothetical protein
MENTTIRRRKRGVTARQRMYARGIIGNEGTKRQVALAAGYPDSMARVPAQKIESTKGFHGAMAEIAEEVNNFGLKVMHHLQTRNLEDVEYITLLRSIDTMANALARFQPERTKEPEGGNTNPLKLVLQQRIQHQTVNNGPETIVVPQEK